MSNTEPIFDINHSIGVLTKAAAKLFDICVGSMKGPEKDQITEAKLIFSTYSNNVTFHEVKERSPERLVYFDLHDAIHKEAIRRFSKNMTEALRKKVKDILMDPLLYFTESDYGNYFCISVSATDDSIVLRVYLSQVRNINSILFGVDFLTVPDTVNYLDSYIGWISRDDVNLLVTKLDKILKKNNFKGQLKIFKETGCDFDAEIIHSATGSDVLEPVRVMVVPAQKKPRDTTVYIANKTY